METFLSPREYLAYHLSNGEEPILKTTKEKSKKYLENAEVLVITTRKLSLYRNAKHGPFQNTEKEHHTKTRRICLRKLEGAYFFNELLWCVDKSTWK
nr:hypothetical protein [Marseillevirus cajuinensis]